MMPRSPSRSKITSLFKHVCLTGQYAFQNGWTLAKYSVVDPNSHTPLFPQLINTDFVHSTVRVRTVRVRTLGTATAT